MSEDSMNLQRVRAVLESPSREAIEALFDDETVVFWVDWREEEESIVWSCENVLKTGSLSAEVVEVKTGEGCEVYIQYYDKRIKIPLTYSMDDRHIAICSLNDILAPDYEVRFCIDSNNSDTLAFVPLTVNDWSEFERDYGDKLSKRFYKIAVKPNLFTDQLPF